MPSSELSNALNPYANQSRQHSNYSVQYDQPVLPQPQQYVPHRSELEIAISEQPPPASYLSPVSTNQVIANSPFPNNSVIPRQPNPANVQAVHELMRWVASNQKANEAERQRRLQWEREQEARFTQQRAEMEKKLHDLTQEVITLRASAANNPQSPNSTGLSTPQNMLSPPLAIPQSIQPASPISPISQPSPYPYPTFVQGSSSQPFHDQPVYDNTYHPSPHTEPMTTQTPDFSVTPSPSPHLASVLPNQNSQSLTGSSILGKKRQNSEISNDSDNSDSDSSSASVHRVKRASHHDRRCLTIHHAMRKHIRLLMDIESDKNLPESHLEGVTLGPGNPVRFVWDKTTKQSVHNSRMKARVLEDIKLNRKKYKHVVEKDFTKKNLEASFEACFVTLRQKYKVQATGMLCSRGHQWRSSRLRRFYTILDEEERAGKSLMPKRGIGKKERYVGPDKEFTLPPERVASWMISKRWIQASQVNYPDLLTTLAKRIENPPGFNWENFDMLGEESDEDEFHGMDRQNPMNYALTVGGLMTFFNFMIKSRVQTSVDLLDSLESFLSTFKKDLSAVSGQISDLQDRSKDIENRLKTRRKIEKPLSSLISDITISPSLATLILDSQVGESWIEAIDDLERHLVTIKARSRVKAARDLGEVAEGLRIVAATKLRAFFLALFQPIRGNVTTNMQVIQTSVLLKYSALFAFLQRQAPAVAHEVQRSYTSAARVYYETGFRRYARSLTSIKARNVEKHETIVNSEREKDFDVDLERLAFAKIAGPGVTLAYMADDKTHREPIEALFRSLLLVFMDNATSEYTFLKSFFSVEASLPTKDSSNSLVSPPSVQSPDRASFPDHKSPVGSDYGAQRVVSVAGSITNARETASSEEQATTALWKQVMDPVLTYCESFVKSVLEPTPPVVPLLTMIRLMEDVVVEVQKRSCPPVEFYVFALRLQMWPVFQKAMGENTDALKKIAEGGNSGYFSRAIATTDAGVANICKRYTAMFSSFIQLTEQEEETMIFSNLLRLRQELAKLILRHNNAIGDVVTKATALFSAYESLLHQLSDTNLSAHPKAQQEIAYWANLKDEARRKIVSAGRQTRH
ncbi:hypothetical protein H0H93_000091 [Arthromyces matolae]|nr:hypothetical protein H0H93_000091 [Arthromyces matolae]